MFVSLVLDFLQAVTLDVVDERAVSGSAPSILRVRLAASWK
jgi:hypothetical protein